MSATNEEGSKVANDKQRTPSAVPEVAPTRRRESAFYKPYAGFAHDLRVWFLAYGIGGPALFVTSDSARHSIIPSGAGRSIAYCFLAGAGFQIIVALLYRTAMWYLYMEEEEKPTPRWLH